MASAGIQALPKARQEAICQAVRNFNEFETGDDPYGEHDFGSFVHEGQKVIFKIDYYDKDLEQGSEDASDETQTTRVMTIMLSYEY